MQFGRAEGTGDRGHHVALGCVEVVSDDADQRPAFARDGAPAVGIPAAAILETGQRVVVGDADTMER